MKMEIKLKKINDIFLKEINKNISQEEIDKEIKYSNEFHLIENHNELYIYVSELFFPENNNIEQDLIDSILSVIYFHNIDIVLKNKIYLSVEHMGEKYFNYLLTASQDSQIKSFLLILEECKLKKEFMDMFIKGEINDTAISNIINKNKIDELLGSELIGFFQHVQKKIINIEEMNEKNIEIGGLNNSSSVKGNIFQLLLARLLFNNKDIIYYNTKGGGIGGNLYPDILFKNGLNLFVCDAKCYHDDNNIVPHKEFFYNIILSNNKKCNVYGLIFTYDKENNANDFIIQKCFKLERHYFYLITINIKNCLKYLSNTEECSIDSLAKKISDSIIENHPKIKETIKQGKDIYTEKEKKIKLINYKIIDDVTDFINNQFNDDL